MISSVATYVLLVSVLLAAAGWAAEQAFLLRRWPRRFPWLAVLAASLLFPMTMTLSAGPAAPASTAARVPLELGPLSASRPIRVHELQGIPVGLAGPVGPAAQSRALVASPAPPGTGPTRLLVNQLVSLVWLSSSAATLCWLLLAVIRLAGLVRRAPRASVQGVPVRIAPMGPAVFGLLRPVILWPRWLDEAPAATQSAAMAHEKQHLVAGDPLLLAVGLILVALAPWNPFLWWQLQRMRFAIEADCDQRVVGGGTDDQAYVQALLQIAERRAAGGAGLAMLMSAPSWLERRVRVLLNVQGLRKVSPLIGVPLTLLALIAAGGLPAPSLREAQLGTPPVPAVPGTRPGVSNVAVEVSIAKAVRGDIDVRIPALGTIRPLSTVAVKAQVSGMLVKVGFSEGQIVHEGDVLAQVDPRGAQAALDQAQGVLQRDQAQLAAAQMDLEAANPQQAEREKNNVDAHRGSVAADEAAVTAAKLQLEATRIVSPVTGRAGLRQVDQGNYVTPSDPNGIVVITMLQPISAVFILPEDDIRQVSKRQTAGAKLPVAAFPKDCDSVCLNTHQKMLAEGRLAGMDSQVDSSTGTIKLRAIFDNKDGALFPQQFVNVVLQVDTLHNQVLVPTAAVKRGPPGTFVYVVDTQRSTVSKRSVVLGESDGATTDIVGGLEAGEVVVIEGGERLRDGAAVCLRPPSTPGISTCEKDARRRGRNSG